MSWPPPVEARPPPRRSRTVFFLVLLGGYIFVSLSIKNHVLQTEPAAADISARRATFERSVGTALAAAATLEAKGGGGLLQENQDINKTPNTHHDRCFRSVFTTTRVWGSFSISQEAPTFPENDPHLHHGERGEQGGP